MVRPEFRSAFRSKYRQLIYTKQPNFSYKP